MKYYYKGQLIRTSKTHNDYKYAVVAHVGDAIKCVSCSATRNGVERTMRNYCNGRAWEIVELEKEDVEK